MKTLYIIRGLPGSGKSTLARKLVGVKFMREADMLFVVDGVYKFDGNRIRDAHAWCFQSVQHLLGAVENENQEDVAVCNTFTRRWEYQPYIELAIEKGWSYQVIEVWGGWQNIHGVPQEKVFEMKNRWQPHS